MPLNLKDRSIGNIDLNLRLNSLLLQGDKSVVDVPVVKAHIDKLLDARINAKPTGCEDNEHSVGRIVEAVKALGFEECESDEDDACEKCGKPCQPLYFGNADYWDCREGDYWCGQCVLKFHEANQQDYAEAMLNAKADGIAEGDSVKSLVDGGSKCD